ncbi:MAG: 30S ribosomal protein S16 [Acidobacteria bacterium]|nr:30S ribosomal protein S16 [Acidobacteriota bacterium]
MLMIRLRRGGGRGRPHYRLIVSEGALQPRGRFLETLGTYDPAKRTEALAVDWAKVDYWMGRGAQPSATVKRILRRARPAAG